MKNLNPIAAELMAEGAEFELVERDINGNRMRVFKNAPENLVVAIEKSRKFSEREFVVSDTERVTFEEFFKRVDALAGYLQTEIGIQKGPACCCRYEKQRRLDGGIYGHHENRCCGCSPQQQSGGLEHAACGGGRGLRFPDL